jgi:two-component system OmpR family response regulator
MSTVEPHVLLVDDDSVILHLLEVNFRLEGFTVTTASRGEQAVQRATTLPPDAVVCDVMMPGLDGFEVLDQVRATPGLGSVPFIFLTGRAVEDDRERISLLDRVDLVSKPFDAVDLIATVRRRIAEAAQ